MKKVFLLIVIIFFSKTLLGNTLKTWEEINEAQEQAARDAGYYNGDPNKTIVLVSTEDYVVLQNFTIESKVKVLSPLDNEIDLRTPQLFEFGAREYCEGVNKNFISGHKDVVIDEHTIFFYCHEMPFITFAKKYSLPLIWEDWSDEERDKFNDIRWCIDSFLASVKDYGCGKREFKKALKKFPGGDIVFENLEKRMDEFTNERFIYEIKKAILANKKQPSSSFGDESEIVAASSGTGFFVSSNGHIVTNNHVIESCNEVKVHFRGRVVTSEVLYTDKGNDLAIIKTNLKPNQVFAVSNEDVTLLEDIIVAGYPLGKAISASIKTSKGSVTSLAGYGDNYSNFQIDASLNSGNSGGPIMDNKGNIVGVAVAKYVEEGVEGFNFGVKSSTLKTFASSNQFKFQDPSTEELSNKELGQLITEATIYLECWMSVAKIKQIIEEGERQKAFFSDYKQ